MESKVQLRKDTEEQLLKRLDGMEQRIKSPEFRQRTATTNTVNYWVFDYNAKQELIVRERIAYIKKKNNEMLDGYKLYVIDLYELMIQHLENNGYIDLCKGFETTQGLDYLITAVKNSLQLTGDLGNNAMVEYITEQVPLDDKSVVFLIGVGKCFPLLQGPEVFNQILYNMPDEYHTVPIIMFYPGTYTEQELIIFNELEEDNYYRAYRIMR